MYNHPKLAQQIAYNDMLKSGMRPISQNKVLAELPVTPEFSKVPKPAIDSPDDKFLYNANYCS